MVEEYPHAQEKHLIHIKGLEATLTQRNEEIERLKRLLHSEEPHQAELKAAYRRGFKACASQLMESTREAALALGKIRADAFETYLEGDKL